MIHIEVRYEDYTEYDREMLLNGCGPHGAGFDLCFKPACDKHDHNYRCGWTEEHRTEYDHEFRQDMHEIVDGIEARIDELPWWRFVTRWVMERTVRGLREAADFYYYLVSEYGDNFFTYREETGEDIHITMETLHREEQERQGFGVRRLSPLMNCLERA